MIKIKCDGHTFKDRIYCEKENEYDPDEKLPLGWIAIRVFENRHRDAHTLQAPVLHFCSRECLEATLFKNEPIEPIEPIKD